MFSRFVHLAVFLQCLRRERHAGAEERIGCLREAFRAGAARGDFKATALFVDVRVQRPGKTAKTDAVHAEIEHAAGYCVDVYFPYSKNSEGKVSIGEAFASKRTGAVFGGCK